MKQFVFPALFEKEDESNEYCVTFPDIKGCVTFGTSLEDAFNMATEALTGHLGVMIEYNDEIPNPSEISQLNHNADGYYVLIKVVI